MSNWQVGPLNPNDTAAVAAVAQLVNSAYRGESSRQGWTTEAEFLEGQRTDAKTLANDVRDPNAAVILVLRAADEARPRGCVFLERVDTQIAYLGMLTIDPTEQARGLGRELLTSAEGFAARRWGVQVIELGVIQLRTSLIAWYERRGYRATGDIKLFPYGDERFGIPRREDLLFVMFRKTLPTSARS